MGILTNYFNGGLVKRLTHMPFTHTFTGSNPVPVTIFWSGSVVVITSACHAEDRGFKSRPDRHFYEKRFFMKDSFYYNKKLIYAEREYAKANYYKKIFKSLYYKILIKHYNKKLDNIFNL